MSNVKLSVVIPCYNERDGLRELHRRVSVICRNLLCDAYEIILVNDGSSDDSISVMSEISSSDSNIIVLDLSRNHGHQLALSAGLSISKGDRVFVLDADLQDPPELLPQMMEKIDQGCDVVFGQRAKRSGETWFKKTTAHYFYRLLNKATDLAMPNDAGDFRLMTRRVVDILNNMPEHHRFIRGLVTWIGFRQEPVIYDRSARTTGESKYPLSKMVRLAIDAVTSFSIRPLRLASFFGGCFGLLSILFLVYIFLAKFTGKTVEGWASLSSIILAIGSVQLFVVGIVGEYLGRMYIESKRRPLFMIKDIITSNKEWKSSAVKEADSNG
jgi:polyisoprenyl-phosphate glycosyltransferase